MEEAKETLKALRRLVNASRMDIYKSVKSLSKTLRNVEDLSAELKDQPSLLLNSKAPAQRTPKER